MRIRPSNFGAMPRVQCGRHSELIMTAKDDVDQPQRSLLSKLQIIEFTHVRKNNDDLGSTFAKSWNEFICGGRSGLIDEMRR